MKRWRQIAFVCLAVGVGVALWMARQPASTPLGIVVLNGRVEGDHADIGAEVAGKVTNLAVHEGAQVKAGALIANLATDQLPAQLQFFAFSVPFLLSAIGLGLLFDALSTNLQQALLMGFFAVMPLFVISGSIGPVESMPWSIPRLSFISPPRYCLKIGLEIFLKGVVIEAPWPQAMAM